MGGAFRNIAAAILFAIMAFSVPALAQVPASELAKPPADAKRYVIMSSAGKHGEYAQWTLADGTRMFRTSYLLRGRATETETAIKVGADGMPANIVVRGFNAGGDLAETFTIVDGQARWKSRSDSGQASYVPGSFYLSQAGNSDFYEILFKAPGQRLKLLPSGEAWLEKLVTISVGEGAAKQDVTAYTVHGVNLAPYPVWLDSDGKFFGVAFDVVYGLSTLPVGYEAFMPVLEKAQTDAMSAKSPALAKKFGNISPVPVAFTNVQMYDAVNKRFLHGQTIVADKGRIVAVGPSGRVKVPANAKTINGSGKTLVPGLWDAHIHVGDDSTGPLLLALGITSARNPGDSVASIQDRAARIARGELLSPAVYSSLLLDGKGPLSAQVGVAASSLEEAIDAIRKTKEAGLTGIKFYGSFNPAWLNPAIAEAKKLGLHIHGHIPAGLRTMDAIEAGYDEITHFNFVMMQALPDDVVNKSNTIARFEGPARYARDVDIAAEPMKSLIETMARRKIYSDPTLAVFEDQYMYEPGEAISPAFVPFIGTLPAVMERNSRTGSLSSGLAVPKDLSRADYRASFAKMQKLFLAMYKAGVPIVAGTDRTGLELIRELELYVDAGLTPAEALQTATLSPAKLVGADKATGSIEVGKEADMVLVDGDPSRRIGDLRHVEWVMSDGALMNGDELRAAAGFSGRPK